MASANRFQSIIVLALNVDNQDSEALKEASKIANSIMSTLICISVFNGIFKIKEEMKDKLKKVSIQFKTYPNVVKEGTDPPLAWTDRMDETKIFINEIIDLRFKNEIVENEERKIIITLIAIFILHEVSHLIMQFRGLQKTPPKNGEAGEYFEKTIFQGLTCPLIEKENEQVIWDQKITFRGT